MKKFLLLFNFSLLIGAALAQDVIYTVSGEIDNNKVSLDSILVENLSNNTWITFNNLPEELYYQINLTKKAYWGTTSISSFDNNLPGFLEAQNMPGEITLTYNNTVPSEARISVFNINGQEIYSSAKQTLFPGNSVQVKLAETGVFLIRIESRLGTQSFKGIGLAGINNYGISVNDNSSFKVIAKSAEGAFESNFEYSIGDSLRISVYKNNYYAQPKGKKIISSENIDFEFKNSEVNISGVSDAFVDLDNQSTNIQDYNPSTGKLSLSYSSDITELVRGNIIAIDADTMGYLRKVTKVVNNNDGSVTLETKQAYLNEVFVNKEINLDTELIEAKSSVKSSGANLDISKALTDENGYIHPVKIIYHYNSGDKVKSALINTSVNDGTVPLFDITDDFSNATIFQNDNVHFYIDEGYSKLNGNATFYFWFKEGTEIDKESKIKKGELEQFSYNMKNTYDFKTHLKLAITDSYNSENSKELLAPKSVTAEFLVGVVPVWITFNLSIHGKYKVSADASVVADWGFQSKISSTAGAVFSNETGDFVQNKPLDIPPNFTINPLKIEGDFNLNARLELYPRIEAMVYSFVGPFVELVPYTTGEVKGKVTSEITSTGVKEFWAWNSNVAAGFDTRVGAKLDFAGIFEDEEFGPLELNLYNEILWNAPKKLALISELPQEVKQGDIVNLEFEVSDSEGNPLAGCPIYIGGEGKFTDEISTTGTNGRTSISWEITTDENGNNQSDFMAKIFDGNKNVVSEVSESVELIGLPTVNTLAATDVNQTESTLNGNVTSDGGSPITERGFYYSLSNETPDSGDNKVSVTGTTGNFAQTITNLTANTTYYFRAYASNTVGTGVGDVFSFKTKEEQSFVYEGTWICSDFNDDATTEGVIDFYLYWDWKFTFDANGSCKSYLSYPYKSTSPEWSVYNRSATLKYDKSKSVLYLTHGGWTFQFAVNSVNDTVFYSFGGYPDQKFELRRE